MTAPLHGLTVVEIGQFIAVPGAAMNLADLGATVIKVEPPGGDAARRVGTFGDGIFTAYNRGKRSIQLDLNDPRCQQALRVLLASADVLVHNLRPAIANRVGVVHDELIAANPDLVIARLTGFGVRGAHQDRAGFDIAAQAESGMMAATGAADGPPTRIGFAVVDAAATYVLSTAVLSALLARHRAPAAGPAERVGVIEVSLLEVAINLQGQLWGDYARTGIPPRRHGNMQPHVAPASDYIAVADGGIVMSAYLPEHWNAVCATLGHPDLHDPRLATSDSRVAHREVMLRALSAAMAEWSVDESIARLSAAGVVVGAVREHADVVASAWAQQEDAFLDVQIGDEQLSCRMPAPPFKFTDASRPTGAMVPALGAHTEEVLVEHGIDDDVIAHILSIGRNPGSDR